MNFKMKFQIPLPLTVDLRKCSICGLSYVCLMTWDCLELICSFYTMLHVCFESASMESIPCTELCSGKEAAMAQMCYTTLHTTSFWVNNIHSRTNSTQQLGLSDLAPAVMIPFLLTLQLYCTAKLQVPQAESFRYSLSQHLIGNFRCLETGMQSTPNAIL